MLISIVIPAYNPGNFIIDAVESVRRQTYSNWEIIIIDDGSTDDFVKLLPRDSRIRVVRQENQGLSIARNVGIAQTRGELIAFLDADDSWHSEKLRIQAEELVEHPNASMTHSQMRLVDENGANLGDGWGGKYKTQEDLYDGNGVCVSSVLIHRSILFAAGLFDPLLRTAQDYDLWLKVTKIEPMVANEAFLVDYRIHSGNMSQNYLLTYRELSSILRRHLSDARQRSDLRTIKRCRRGLRRTRYNAVLQAMRSVVGAVKARDLAATAKHALQSVRVSLLLTVYQVLYIASSIVVRRLTKANRLSGKQ